MYPALKVPRQPDGSPRRSSILEHFESVDFLPIYRQLEPAVRENSRHGQYRGVGGRIVGRHFRYLLDRIAATILASITRMLSFPIFPCFHIPSVLSDIKLCVHSFPPPEQIHPLLRVPGEDMRGAASAKGTLFPTVPYSLGISCLSFHPQPGR